MDLPKCYLADLPPEAEITPTLVTEACLALKTNRRMYLAGLGTEHIVNALAELGQGWTSPTDPFRRLAEKDGPAATGFPVETLMAGLDSFFGRVTVGSIEALIVQDLGHLQRLDRLVAGDAEAAKDRVAIANGPELLVHITGGVLPDPTLTSIILGLLVRSAQFIKCASGTSFIPRLFAHSLREIEPKLAACLEIAEWKGGTAALETALFAHADCVTATGSDEALGAIRARVPLTTRFLGHGHRVSFAYVSSEVLSSFGAEKIASRAARDVAAWNQRGCLSPHVIYVETGGRITPEKFAEMLASQLTLLEQSHPRGPLRPQDAAAIAARRSFYEVRAAHSIDTIVWRSTGSTAWTVVYENDPAFQVSCLNRFIYVKAVADLEHALSGADAVRGIVSTVGLAGAGPKAQRLAAALAQWGATRICPLGRMQEPPLSWRHDGRPSLGELVTWSDWEA